MNMHHLEKEPTARLCSLEHLSAKSSLMGGLVFHNAIAVEISKYCVLIVQIEEP